MTVLDTSAVIDLLLARESADEVRARLTAEGPAAAPDLLVFEVLAVLRRHVIRSELTAERARGALEDLADLAIELFPAMALRDRAFELRDNFTAADALFTALAERLREPLLTKDAGLAAAVSRHTGVEVIVLGS